MEKAKTDAILAQICQQIGGEWLLLGGTLVQLFYNGERSTEDIDLVQMGHSTKSKDLAQTELFQFTLKNWGMGPEFINLAAEFFVQELEGWRDEVVLMYKGPAGRVWRPSLTLFCALKARRGSELDQRDIQQALTNSHGEQLNQEKLAKWLSPGQLRMITICGKAE